MSEATAVALFSALEWPEGALGRRALLAFEPYDARVFSLDPDTASDPISCLLERGFARQVPGGWAFLRVQGHSLGIFEDSDEIALIDEAGDLFVYPLTALPHDWLAHVGRERYCLVVTGVGLSLATGGLEGVHRAAARGEAVGGAVMLVNSRRRLIRQDGLAAPLGMNLGAKALIPRDACSAKANGTSLEDRSHGHSGLESSVHRIHHSLPLVASVAP